MRGRGQRAEPVDHAFGEVGRDRGRGSGQAERERLDQDPADQELAVRAALHRDRATEHVREQQHEHERLERDVEQLLGDLADVLDVAAGEHERVAPPLREPAPFAGHHDGRRGRRSTGVASAVAVMRTASSARARGARQGQEDVVERRLPAVEVDRVDMLGVERTHHLHEAGALGDGDGRAAAVTVERGGVGREAARSLATTASSSVGTAHRDLDAVGADAGLQLARRAVRDGAGRGRGRRCRRRAGRPRRGTAW